MTTTTHREQVIEGFRLFADFLAAHPEYPATREHVDGLVLCGCTYEGGPSPRRRSHLDFRPEWSV